MLKLAGTKNITAAANEVVRTLSSYPKAISHGVVASKILEKIITFKGQQIEKIALIKSVQGEVKNMFPDVENSVHTVIQHLDMDHTDAVKRFGRQCYNPGSLQVFWQIYLVSINVPILQITLK